MYSFDSSTSTGSYWVQLAIREGVREDSLILRRSSVTSSGEEIFYSDFFVVALSESR